VYRTFYAVNSHTLLVYNKQYYTMLKRLFSMADKTKKTTTKSTKGTKSAFQKDNTVWIFLSIIFGVIGGGVAWLVLRKRSASAALTCLLIGAGVTVLTGAGFFLTLLMGERPDTPKYTVDQVLSAAQQMSPECDVPHT